MQKVMMFFAAAFLLSGCASQIMQSYVGGSIQEPILDYGPPTNVLDLEDGRRAYQWRITSSGAMPVTSPTTATVYGSAGYATAYGTSTTYVPYSQECLYTLTAVQQGERWIVDGFRDPGFWCE